MDRFYNGWEQCFEVEFAKPYFVELKAWLVEQYREHTVYPPASQLLHAFDLTSPDELRVVILGQDPYISYNQAMGLAFSVPTGVLPPMSLRNIFREIHDDLGYSSCIVGGDLTPWAEQGVLLLNTVLSVQEGKSGSHRGKGWEKFTDSVIRYIETIDRPIVYLLWGREAQAKQHLVTNSQHKVLLAPHPSPLSAYTGFFGCGHFSKTNDMLSAVGREIKW